MNTAQTSTAQGKGLELHQAPNFGQLPDSTKLERRLTAAIEELRQCITYLGNDDESRQLLYHAGRTIWTILERHCPDIHKGEP